MLHHRMQRVGHLLEKILVGIGWCLSAAALLYMATAEAQESFFVPEGTSVVQARSRTSPYKEYSVNPLPPLGDVHQEGQFVEKQGRIEAPLGYAIGREPSSRRSRSKFDSRKARQYRNSILNNPTRFYN